MQARRYRHRGASLYLVVLAGAFLVSLIGISALTAVRIQRRSAESAGDLIEARFYARSAIDMGLFWIETDSNWRDYHTSGSWADDVPIGTGTFSLNGVDPGDGNLSDADSDPVVLTGTGVKGDARHKTQVTLVAYHPPLSCLEVALHAGNDILFSAAALQCDQTISANNSVVASSSMINSEVQAVNNISGGEYFGSTTTGITPRDMPDAAAFEYYLANGTAISINSIPLDVEGRVIEDVVISPASNPYGAETNTEGIYVIDCLAQEIRIRDSRIVGTLVLVSPGSASKVYQSVNWQAAVGNYPALLVAGRRPRTELEGSHLRTQPAAKTPTRPIGIPR